MDLFDQTQKYCDNCGRPFDPNPLAPHKHFCSVDCRTKFNNRKGAAKKKAKRMDAYDRTLRELDMEVESGT